MKTFQLWLEPDSAIPRFKRLAFTRTDVPIADVLLRGIHPWQGTQAHLSLPDKFVEILNDDDMKPAALAQFSYCADVSGLVSHSTYHTEKSTFEEMLQNIRESLYFADGLSYAELLEIAKERLRKTWSYQVVHRLLSHSRSSFEEMRSFLKAKDKNLKFSSYADIERCDLASILRLEDFEGEDSVLIGEGLPIVNFRSEAFIKRVTDEHGLLRLTDCIRDFQITIRSRTNRLGEALIYNCHRSGHDIRFTPNLGAEDYKRDTGKAYAERWAKDKGRYCFTTSIDRLEQMQGEDECHVGFPTLNYSKETEPRTSSAKVAPSNAPRYSVRHILTESAPGNQIRSILKRHGVSMTGRKEELVEKLARLAADVYASRAPELDAYFSTNRFIHLKCVSSVGAGLFPLLNEVELGPVILTMYIFKHLRGNAILEASHQNNDHDLATLARALIQSRLSLSGSFLRVA